MLATRGCLPFRRVEGNTQSGGWEYVVFLKAGVLSSHRDVRGQLVDDDPRRFGFHNLRHSLASFLIRIKTDPKTVQTLLRHSDVKLTLQFYTHAVSRDRMVAAGKRN
jgi:integrase